MRLDGLANIEFEAHGREIGNGENDHHSFEDSLQCHCSCSPFKQKRGPLHGPTAPNQRRPAENLRTTESNRAGLTSFTVLGKVY